MKTLALLLGMFLVTNTIAIQSNNNSANSKETGIQFHKCSMDEALKLAKKERKLVFLNISASWCGPCKMLKSRTFSNEEVGNFYNSNFINIAVDGEIGEGIELARKYEIKGYPTLIFLDGNDNLIAQTAGFRNPKEFLNLGKQIIEK